MNKQELIDRCVEKRCGCIGAGNDAADVIILEDDEFFAVTLGYLKGVDENKYSVVCTRAEFEQRAKELGWINGYKWGVEYPTNGKKPNLPDDVVLKVEDINGARFRTDKLKNITWEFYRLFRIVDERYKPAERPPEAMPVSAEMEAKIARASVNWYDYDKQESLALPPVGIDCEYYDADGWQRCKILATDSSGRFIVELFGDCTVIHSCENECYTFRPLDWSRKAEEDKQRVVDSVLDSIKLGYNREILTNILEQVYELGFLKLPEQK